MSNLSTNTNFEVTTISPENLAKRWDIDPSTVYKSIDTRSLESKPKRNKKVTIDQQSFL